MQDPRPPARPHRARKRFGQHFLVDRGAAERIVGVCAVSEGEAVVEIGPGPGALTERLIERAGRVAAVEIDRDLAEGLRRRFADRLLLIEGDAVRISFADVAERLTGSPRTPLVLVGNLPYNISKPIAMKLVAERTSVARGVFTFQREVADRILAMSGGREYGPMGILCRWAYAIERRFDLPPGAFRPPPQVTSTVTWWAARPSADAPRDLDGPLREVLSACFRRRRRTLLGNLREALGGEAPARAILAEIGVDPSVRAEELGPETFVGLAGRWPGVAPDPA